MGLIQSFLETIGLRAEEDEREALTKSEVKKLLYHNPFSRYLVYGYYDEELGIYYNLDDTAGIIFECIPVAFASAKTLDMIEALLKSSFPEGSVMQIICYADPYVEDTLALYVYGKKKAPSYVRKAYERLAEFLSDRKKSGFPVRNFRTFVTLKFPVKESITREFVKEVKKGIYEGLISAELYSFEVTPDVLVSTLRRLFNDRRTETESVWTPYAPLRKQIIYADTVIEKKGKIIHLGNKKVRVFSPKSLPNEVDFLFGNFISGSYEGVVGDYAQISSPFMITFNIILKDEKTNIHTKANLILQQQAFGSFVPSLQRKKDEYLWALGECERGERFYPVVITCFVYDEDEKELETSYFKATKLWERLGCVVQEESALALPLFVYSLPFGFVHDKNTLLFLDRHFVLPAKTIPAMLPIQADFNTAGCEPVLLFVGRKGELVGFDFFAKGAANYNFAIFAPTGKGKSFLANYVVANYLGKGAKVRIVDVGGSYRKLCNMFGGTFIDFHPDSDICINFFETVREPQHDLPVITQILIHMTIPQTGELPSHTTAETAVNIMKATVDAVFGTKGTSATVDDVYEYLTNFTKYFEDRDLLCSGEGKEACEAEFATLATHLAFNLRKYTSYGPYGKWFVGKTNFDVSSSDFIVLELEHLKPVKDLFNVIVLAVMNAVTFDLYLSSRDRPTIVLLDEAWQFLQDAKAFQDVIEEGYRRARKYYGSFGIITQSVLDLEHFGRVGQVINTNAGTKFYLESGDFHLAREKKLLPFDDEFTFKLLTTVKYNAPKYSEIFVYSERFGTGVMRLMVDPYSYFVYTSNPAEIAEIESMVKSGMSYEEAIEKMIEKRKKS